MPSVRQRGTRLSNNATEDPSPVPAKRAKLSHKEDPQRAAKDVLKGGRISAHTLDHSSNRQRSQFDESRAIVTNGVRNGDVDTTNPPQSDVVEISSESEDDDEEDDEGQQRRAASQLARTNGASRGSKSLLATDGQAPLTAISVARNTGEDGDEDDEEDGAPTFGELAARDEPIEVEDEQTALVPAPNQSLTAPNALTLTSVLTQALRTNDNQMLESCLLLNDLESIRKTIERLPSPLVATLLRKLSERLHRRPGRAGNLLIWVQWSLVAHGGYLATQPDVVRKLQELRRVIKERAAALQPLMGLKGRLDMLAAQVELRKSAQAEQQASRRSGEEDAVIYVEGEESSSSEEGDGDDDDTLGQSLAKRITGRDYLDVGVAESSEDETMLVNGMGGSDEEDEVDEDDDVHDGDDRLIDDEAEDSDDDEDEDDDLSADDAEDEEIDGASDEEEDDRPATRRSTALRGSGFARR